MPPLALQRDLRARNVPVNEERLLTQNATAGHATIRMPALRALRPRTYRLTTKVIDKHGRAAVARRIVGI